LTTCLSCARIISGATSMHSKILARQYWPSEAGGVGEVWRQRGLRRKCVSVRPRISREWREVGGGETMGGRYYKCVGTWAGKVKRGGTVSDHRTSLSASGMMYWSSIRFFHDRLQMFLRKTEAAQTG
jgi:hypothetical protein